jgi:hypothetical protein
VDHNAGGSYFSFILRVNSSWNGTTFNGQIVLSDGRRVSLTEGTYSIRVWLDETNHWVRGTIHDEKRGATLHFQSGDRVSEFMRDLLIIPPPTVDREPDQTDS